MLLLLLLAPRPHLKVERRYSTIVSAAASSTCGRFVSRFRSSVLGASGSLFLESLTISLLLLSAPPFSAALRASRSFLSFSRRSALDSNSCQSPSICWSLLHCVFLLARQKFQHKSTGTRRQDSLYNLPWRWVLRGKVGVLQYFSS